MYHFLHVRSRLFQSLILGLIALTFYAYYYTAANDDHQFAVLQKGITGRPPVSEALRTSSNVSTDSQLSTALKNITGESSNLNLSASHNNINPPTLISTLSTSSSQAPSSASLPSNFKRGSEQPGKHSERAIDVTGNSVDNASARAIYEAGHLVPIPKKCPNSGRDMELAIIVMSAPGHVEARTAIRQTWGHYGQRKDVSIMFMLGSTNDANLERVLRKEQDLYADLIRGKFLDSYSNLTLKTISTLEWVDTYCSNVKFVLKTDDDMFINVPRLMSFAKKHAKDKNVIYGRLAKKWKPIRNKKSKYYVSQAQYNPAVFPDFTTGPAYLMSRDIVHKLYNASLDQTYLKLEDVFMTGIVAQKLKIKRSHANEFLNKRIAFSPCNVQRGISIHMVKYSEQFDLWKKLLDGKSKCK